jgi:hypothetical protein
MFNVSNKLYDNLNNQNLLIENINGLDIAIDSSWKRIGINLSGGADSALLTFLICSIIKKHNLNIDVNIITYQRCWTTRPWQGWWSLQVFNKLKTMFPNIIKERYTNYIPPELEYGVSGPIINGRSGDQIIVGSFNKFAAWQYKLDAVYNATSKNPSDDTREDRMSNRDKDAENGTLSDIWSYNKELNVALVHPFRFVQKDWIVAQYHMHDILDLYNTTRSCEGDIKINKKIIEAVPQLSDYKEGMEVPVCEECWWCHERKWAESQVKTMIEKIKNG